MKSLRDELDTFLADDHDVLSETHENVVRSRFQHIQNELHQISREQTDTRENLLFLHLNEPVEMQLLKCQKSLNQYLIRKTSSGRYLTIYQNFVDEGLPRW